VRDGTARHRIRRWGVTLRGWFYPAEGAGSPGPAVVMAHGFSAVKEMYLDRFAEMFAAAGLNVLVFDNRCFGASDGEPRQEIDPWAQVRDYRDAITYLHTLPEVDPGRIGIWGSYSGGHVLVVAAIDRRVKAVVSQVPLISGHANLRALVRADFIAGFRELFDADRLARFQGKAPGMVPVVDKDPLAPSALPTPDSWEWFSQTGETRAPAWRNEVTLRSVEMFTEYEPAQGAHHHARRPLRRLHRGLRDLQRPGPRLVPAPPRRLNAALGHLRCHAFDVSPEFDVVRWRIGDRRAWWRPVRPLSTDRT
jgi:dienelactone hydrolase